MAVIVSVKHDAASDTWKAFGHRPEFAKNRHKCHALVKARDFVFTSDPKR